MARNYSWHEFDQVMRQIWPMAKELNDEQFNPEYWRCDDGGRPIKRDQYSRPDSYFGWYVNDEGKPQSYHK